MFTVVHFLNHFFAGLGGEEKADTPAGVLEGAAGAARGLQLHLGEEARVKATVYCGDNYFHDKPEESKAAILEAVRAYQPQVLAAGPAFNSGRYGLACVEVCQVVAQALDIPCVTAMFPENPALETYRSYHNPKLFLLPTSETAAGMGDALARMGSFACRLAKGAALGPAQEEGYLPRGIRRPERANRPGVERAITMLLRKLHHEPFVTELPMEVWDRVTPAPALSDLGRVTIGVVTTSGVVPWGNPDGFRTFRNIFWRKYSIADARGMEPGRWEAVHGGYNVGFMNENPNYGVPLDTLRALEAEGVIGRLYPAYYVVPGNQGAPLVMRRIGQEIAADLQAEGVDGVLLVCT